MSTMNTQEIKELEEIRSRGYSIWVMENELIAIHQSGDIFSVPCSSPDPAELANALRKMEKVVIAGSII